MMEDKRKIRLIIFIVLSIILIVLVIGLGFLFFYNKPVKPRPIVDNRPSEVEKKIMNTISDEEIAVIKGKVFDEEVAVTKGKLNLEIETYFYAEKDRCKQKFSGLENKGMDEIKKLFPEILKINFPKGENFLMCSGVKEGKTDICSLLPEDLEVPGDSHRVDLCKKNIIYFIEMVFPSLRANNCSQEGVKICDALGEKDCQSLCNGLFSSKSKKDCENLPDKSFSKITCLAINRDNVDLCDALTNWDEVVNCQNNFYFIKAVRTKDLSYLVYLGNRAAYHMSQLYFNPSYDCRKVFENFSEKCDIFYNQNRLQLLFGKAHELNNSK